MKPKFSLTYEKTVVERKTAQEIYGLDAYADGPLLLAASLRLGSNEQIVAFRVPAPGEYFVMTGDMCVNMKPVGMGTLYPDGPRFIVEKVPQVILVLVGTYETGDWITIEEGQYFRYIGPYSSKSFYRQETDKTFRIDCTTEIYAEK